MSPLKSIAQHNCVVLLLYGSALVSSLPPKKLFNSRGVAFELHTCKMGVFQIDEERRGMEREHQESQRGGGDFGSNTKCLFGSYFALKLTGKFGD